MNRLCLFACFFPIAATVSLLCSSCAGDSKASVTAATAEAAPDGAPSPGAVVHKKDAAPIVISHGQQVILEDYLVPGKTTIFEFTSRFDGHCRTVSKRLDALHTKRDDIAVVRIDVNRPEIKGVDWSSPVCQQYEIHAVPAFRIFDAEGKQTADGKKAVSLVDRWTDR